VKKSESIDWLRAGFEVFDGFGRLFTDSSQRFVNRLWDCHLPYNDYSDLCAAERHLL